MSAKTSPKIKIIAFFLRQHPYRLAIIIALSLLASLFEAMNVFFLFAMLNSLVGTSAIQTFGQPIIEKINFLLRLIPIDDPLIATCVLVIFSVLFKSLFSYCHKLFSAYTSFTIWSETQEKAYRKFLQSDYQFFLNHKQGELIFRAYTATGSIGSVFKWVPDIIFEGCRLLMLVFALAQISLFTTVAIIVIGAVYYVLVKNIARHKSYQFAKKKIAADQREIVLVGEMIEGIRQIKINAAQTHWMSRYLETLNDYFTVARKERIWQLLPTHLLEALTIILIAGFLIVLKLFSPGNFLIVVPIIGAFGYAFLKIMPSMSNLGLMRITIMETMPTIELLYNTFNEKTQSIFDGDTLIGNLKDAIALRNISFAYPTSRNVLDQVSITFKKGTVTALVGPSGSGKTTIANLLVRLFIPQKGEICIDDININDCQIGSWLEKVGFVTQDTFIFHGTIADNITFGIKADQPVIERAAKDASAHDFIMQLPERYQTIVGDRGMKLSGGQRQRIAIARALMRKPQVLILDEATSSLDNTSELQVQEAINRISKDRTVITIAHRLSTVIAADKIIVIDGGKVVETGTHAELMSQKGLYWKLYNNEKSQEQKRGENKEAVIYELEK